MSSSIDYILNDQIYENNDKTISIFKTHKTGSHNYIAVKVYNKKYLKVKYNYEYILMNKIKNEAIVNISSCSEDKNYFYMEMEYCPKGDLAKCIGQNKSNLYSEKTIKLISRQLLSGLQMLHKNGIIHCNLKPSNILIDEYGNAKICDFKKCLKVSTMNSNLMKKNKSKMSPCYTAPELLQKEGKYSFKSDLWSLGCIMYELSTGKVPFFGYSIFEIIKRIMHEDVNFNKKELSNYSDDFIEVLKKLLVKDPNERANWGDIEKMPWWDGYFCDLKVEVNIENDSSSVNAKNCNINTPIDPLKLTKFAVQNKMDEKEEYNNDKVSEICSIDQEFDFQSKDLEDLFDNLNSNANSWPNFDLKVEIKLPKNVTVLNIRKVLKKDKRNYNDTNAQLFMKYEKEEEKLTLGNLIQNHTDKIIKPIIGNKNIEDIEQISYNKNKLPFNPWKNDILKEMINSEKDLKNVEKYLYQIFSLLVQFSEKKDYDNLINLLKYFETIVFDRELANSLINTSFIQKFISFLQNVDNEQVKSSCCCLIGYLVRYATIIEVPLDNYGFCEIICDVIKNSNDSSDLIKKASATIGEYLFYVATKEESQENKEWTIKKKYLDILLYCLDEPRNEIVKFYTIKAIENICILTKVSKAYFTSSEEYMLRILKVYLTTSNIELKLSAISTISQLLRHNPTSLIKPFLDNLPILSDKNVWIKETEGIRQCLINCVLFSIVGKCKILLYIKPEIEIFTQILLSFFEQSNNVIKTKIIILLGFLMVEKKIIFNYGEEIFIKMKKIRTDKNKEIHYAVKLFEKFVKSNSPSYIKNFNSLLNKDKVNEIIYYCKIFNITGLYHKISYTIFTSELLDSIKKYIKNKLSKSENNNELIGNLLDVLIKFSENPFSVEQNIDIILNGFLLEILQMSIKIKGDENLSKIRIICSNIFTNILNNESLYSRNNFNNKEGLKTKEIQNMINNLIPFLKTLLQNKDIEEGVWSLLSLIIENDENFIVLYRENGIIDYIYKIMELDEFSNNLNIIKILIILTKSKDLQFEEILSMGLIDKVNFLLEKSFNNNDDENSYLDSIFELFYEMMYKIMKYRRIIYPKNTRINLESYKKNFLSKIEKIGKNFNLCIKLLGNKKNVSIQEISCTCIIYLLQIFPDLKIKSLNMQIKFKSSDIPYLLKGLELSCYKIHKKMIKILEWIIEFQDDAKLILKPYASYITTYLENIINTSENPDIIKAAKDFINNKIKKIR